MANAPWIAVILKLGVLFLPLASALVAGILFLSPGDAPIEHKSVKPPPIHVVVARPS